jgi:hypothetical protein
MYDGKNPFHSQTSKKKKKEQKKRKTLQAHPGS